MSVVGTSRNLGVEGKTRSYPGESMSGKSIEEIKLNKELVETGMSRKNMSDTAVGDGNIAVDKIVHGGKKHGQDVDGQVVHGQKNKWLEEKF